MRGLGLTLNPLWRRRLHNFKANRRGYISFWIFFVLFGASLFAEFIANDKPIIVKYDNALYWPVFHRYAETTFGGDFETETDYRDPYVRELIDAQGWMIWPLVEYDYRTINYDLARPSPAPPSSENWLGTDDQGRDVLARLIYGFRLSVLFGLTLTILSSAVGIIAGAVQGYFGGLVDLVFQRFIEVWSSLPYLYLLLIVSSFFAPSVMTLLFVLLLFGWMGLVDVVRAECLRVRNFEYVRAARALGAGHFTVIRRHVLPNAMVSTFTFMPFILSGSVAALTALDFLGLGLPPGSASLGEILQQGKANLQAPWLGLSGFVVISVLLSLLVFIGEATRDAFDPRKLYGR